MVDQEFRPALGSCFSVLGLWFLVLGFWRLALGSELLVLGSQLGSWHFVFVLSLGSRLLALGLGSRLQASQKQKITVASHICRPQTHLSMVSR